MKKTLLATALGVGLGTVSLGAQAALVTGTQLTLDPGVLACIGKVDIYPDCNIGVTVVDGSYFAMGASRVALQPGTDGGIIIGQIQTGSGAHGGFPNGTETTPIDMAWGFFCNTGFHYTTAPISVIDNDVNSDGGFTQSLDMSGWTVGWSGIPEINIGGIGSITCSLADCAAGSTYVLNYATPIPSSPLHSFGGVAYSLVLKGTVVAPIPVPAAVWLFGSGLLGLVGVARRKHSS